MSKPIDQGALDQIFLEARSHNAWRDQEVSGGLLVELIDIMKTGPTSANCSPARILFLKTPAAKERLKSSLSPGNQKKTMAAPVCAVIGHDMSFYDHLPKLFPHNDAKSWFAGKPDHIATTAFRNGTLQGAYFIIAARALGLDTGPMSGFDNAGVDQEFFAGTNVKSNFLCNLGYGDASGLFSRSPSFDFDEIAQIL